MRYDGSFNKRLISHVSNVSVMRQFLDIDVRFSRVGQEPSLVRGYAVIDEMLLRAQLRGVHEI